MPLRGADATDFQERGRDVVIGLQTVLQYVNEPHREKNRQLFEKVAENPPSLVQAEWANVAFVAEMFGAYMGNHALDEQQRSAVWKGLMWATRYELGYRDSKNQTRALQNTFRFFGRSAVHEPFARTAFGDLETLISELDHSQIGILEEAVGAVVTQTYRVPLMVKIQSRRSVLQLMTPGSTMTADTSAPRLTSVLEPLGRTGSAEIDAVLETLERYMGEFLDKRQQHSDYLSLQSALESADSVSIHHRLTVVSGVVVRNVLYRYAHSESSLLDDDSDLERVISVATFALTNTAGQYEQEAQLNQMLLKAVRGMRTGKLSPSVILGSLSSIAGEKLEVKSSGLTSALSSLTMLVARHLLNKHRLNDNDTTEADEWTRLLSARAASLTTPAIERLLAALKNYQIRAKAPLRDLEEELAGRKTTDVPNKLTLLDSEELKAIEDSIRLSDFDRVIELLRSARPRLLSGVSRLLSDPLFGDILPPRRAVAVTVPGNKQNQFERARRLLHSDKDEERMEGLRIFEHTARTTTHHHYAPVAEEWLQYALAKAISVARVSGDWEEARNLKKASWEQIWNLAHFYTKTGHPSAALDVLHDGVVALRAPFLHLRFALYSALQVLEREAPAAPGSEGTSTYAASHKFLIDHLPKYSLAECYLVWCLLAKEGSIAFGSVAYATMLGKFQELRSKPIQILDPTQKLTEFQMEDFREKLLKLDRGDTWLLWINDYVQRNLSFYKGYLWLSEESTRQRDFERAEEALQALATRQLEAYQRAVFDQTQGRVPKVPPELLLRRLGLTLVNIFRFYRANQLSGNRDIGTFNRYYKDVPQLWHGAMDTNATLLTFTRRFLEEARQEEDPRTAASATSTGSEVPAWYNLDAQLARVNNLERLVSLRAQLEAALSLVRSGSQVVTDRIGFIRSLVNQFFLIGEERTSQSELPAQLGDISSKLQSASRFISEERELQRLTSTISALQRVFEDLSKRLSIRPNPSIRQEIDGKIPMGLADDISETSLLVMVENPGPGAITNLRLSCVDRGVIGSLDDTVIGELAENEQTIVSIPVGVQAPPDLAELDCRIVTAYEWGLVRDLRVEQPLKVPLFSWAGFLRDHEINSYDIPNPFVERPLDFSRPEDSQIFQGREGDLDFVRRTVIAGQPTDQPIYFHGIRKVGKTTLLNRLALELKLHGLLPVRVELTGIDATKNTIGQVANSLTAKVLDACSALLLGIGPEPVPTDHSNPALATEQFFSQLAVQAAGKRWVLLLDEFQLLVAPNTVSLLDTIRGVYQQNICWFIMTGLRRPFPLYNSCPQAQLFPLKDRALDLLPVEAVARVLREPTRKYGLVVPEATVREAFSQSGGNPYYLAHLGRNAIALLNSQHRNVVSPSDMQSIAHRLARTDASIFVASTLSPLTLPDPKDKDAAIQFAKELPRADAYLPYADAKKLLGDKLQRLEEEYIVELTDDASLARMRGSMLAEYLRTRPSGVPEPKSKPDPASKKVGVFVDYENIAKLAIEPLTPKKVGEQLLKYAGRFGDIVARWAAFNSRNVPDPYGVKLQLETAGNAVGQLGFDVQFADADIDTKDAKATSADFLLLDLIEDEREHREPDIYIICTADRDFRHKIKDLLEHGYEVRLVCLPRPTLGQYYIKFNEERAAYRRAEGFTESDFFIDDLEQIVNEVEP